MALRQQLCPLTETQNAPKVKSEHVEKHSGHGVGFTRILSKTLNLQALPPRTFSQRTIRTQVRNPEPETQALDFPQATHEQAKASAS